MPCYEIETAKSPKLSMMCGPSKPAAMMDAFHKLIGRPESFITYDEDFSLHIEKGQTIKEALNLAAEDLRHPDGIADNTPEQDMSARHHVKHLLATL